MIYSIYHEKRSISNDVFLYKSPSLVFGQDYELLMVGSEYDTEKYPDNINHLNPFINELTGLYHIWKYCDEDEVVGLCHYRRALIHNQTEKWLTLEDANKVLQTSEMICSIGCESKASLITCLRCDLKEDEHFVNKYFDILCEYEPGFRRYFEMGRYVNTKNMFICKKAVIDKYCEFLFPIAIPMAEKFMKEDAKYCTNIRILGYIFERVLTYWLKAFEVKYTETGYRELTRKLL